MTDRERLLSEMRALIALGPYQGYAAERIMLCMKDAVALLSIAKPVVTVEMIDAAMVEVKNLHPPMRRSDCERLLRAALSAPASPPAGVQTDHAVEVKALEWVSHQSGTWYSRCPVSGKEYLLSLEEGQWWPAWDASLPAFATPDDAFRAAQADYEARIRSALAHPASAPAPAVGGE